MKLKDYTQEELESMNYDDIAYLILTEEKTQLKLKDLFQKICDLLNMDKNSMENEITNFFELISTDKRFIMLDNGLWDLKEKHNPKMVLVDDEEELDSELEEENLEVKEQEEPEEEIFYDDDDEDDNDDDDDDLKDLVVVDEEQTNSL